MGYGVDKNSLDNRGFAPLHIATQNNYLPVLQVILAADADTNLRFGDQKNSVLVLAIASWHTWVISVITHHGADINAVNSEGRTPLHAAALGEE